MACLQELQHECFMMGIPLRTRHREVAPNQYEVAPMFGLATTQIDQNLMVMQVLEEVSARHGLAALCEEKPFNDVNGSGKHNNFSLGTDTGLNLLNVGDVTAASGKPEIFPLLMACIVRAVDVHGDLMRMAIASPGNDFRLGACEAPPAIVSTYLGDDLTNYLKSAMESGTFGEYKPNTSEVDLGIPSIAPFTVPSEDRNRTSPFPFGGHRFEFRAVGSAQNVSMVNTVLCTIFAESFAMMSDAIEAGKKPADVATEFLKEHWKVIFNGNGYSEEWPIEAGKRGVWRIDSGVESMKRMSDPKNVALFEKMKVMSQKEMDARTVVMYEHYAGYVEIEAGAMVDMMKQHVIPSVKNSDGLEGLLPELEAACSSVEKGLHGMHDAPDEYTKASLARVLRLETMIDARAACDKAEGVVPADMWTLATYNELLFLDKTHADAADGFQ
jgi:glutamine synthetase